MVVYQLLEPQKHATLFTGNKHKLFKTFWKGSCSIKTPDAHVGYTSREKKDTSQYCSNIYYLGGAPRNWINGKLHGTLQFISERQMFVWRQALLDMSIYPHICVVLPQRDRCFAETWVKWLKSACYRATCYSDLSYVAKMHSQDKMTSRETFVF